MKEIWCPTCRAPVWTSKDIPLTMAHFTSGQHYMVVKCARCTNSFKLTPGDFARMPEVSVVK